MSQVHSIVRTMDWKLDWLAACEQMLKIRSHMGWDRLSHSIVGSGTVHFQMALFIFRLFFFAAIFKLPVILSSNPPPLHSELVSSLLKDYNHHLVPLNVSNSYSLFSGFIIFLSMPPLQLLSPPTTLSMWRQAWPWSTWTSWVRLAYWVPLLGSGWSGTITGGWSVQWILILV